MYMEELKKIKFESIYSLKKIENGLINPCRFCAFKMGEFNCLDKSFCPYKKNHPFVYFFEGIKKINNE